MKDPITLPALDSRRSPRGAAGLVARLTVYLREMYPPLPRLMFAALLAASLFALTARIHQKPVIWTDAHLAVAIVGVFLFLLVLRLMDELKDLDIDRELFADRPVPSGRVRITDVGIALAFCSVAFVAINAWAPTASPWAVLVLGYSVLMFRYFFAPNLLRRVLLLNLLTHNPVVLLLLLWVVAVFADRQQAAMADLNWRTMALVLGGYWSALLAWEIARKIRAPEEETDYVTYSQVLGRRTAALVTLSLQATTFGAALHLQRAFDLSPALVVVLGVALAVAAFTTARFSWRPSPSTSRRLRPFAEHYILALCVAVILGVELS
jgi:4-hydroxybenzoate polyprenyltransferase